MLIDQFSEKNKDVEKGFIYPQEMLEEYLGYGSKLEGEGPYSGEELGIIEDTLDNLYEEMTACISPADERQELFLAVGGPAAGKSTYIDSFLEDSDKGYGLIDMDYIRENLSLCVNAMSDKRAQGASIAEADDYAFKKYQNAGIYIGRALLNRLYENGYNAVYCIQPASFNKYFDLFKSAREQGTDLKINFFNAPYEELQKSVEHRTAKTGRGLQDGVLDKQYKAMPEAVKLAMGEGMECNFYWRERCDSCAVMVSSTVADGMVDGNSIFEVSGTSSFMHEPEVF